MEKIAIATPANATAGRVVSTGTHFAPSHRPREDFFRSEIQPALKPWREVTGNDLTGVRFGRLTVVGYSALVHGRWVVKCDCGWYELRRGKAVKNPNNSQDMCMDCRKTFLITHGYDVNEVERIPKEERIRREQAGELQPRRKKG